MCEAAGLPGHPIKVTGMTTRITMEGASFLLGQTLQRLPDPPLQEGRVALPPTLSGGGKGLAFQVVCLEALWVQ